MSKADNDNHSNQLNPNNDAYYSSRGDGYYDEDDNDDGLITRSSRGLYDVYADHSNIKREIPL